MTELRWYFQLPKFNLIHDVLSGSVGKRKLMRDIMRIILVTGIETPQFILVLQKLQYAEQINHGSQGHYPFGWYFLTKYYSGDEIKKCKMGRACAMCGENRNAYRFLVGTHRK
jgi:hypothetical protein